VGTIDVYLNNEHKAPAADLELLGHLKAFSWVSSLDKTHLLSALETANFTKHDVIVRESELASNAHILLAGSASITCLNVKPERVMVALLPLGPVPEFPEASLHSISISNWRLMTIAVWAALVGSSSTSSPRIRRRPLSGSFIEIIFNSGIDCCCVAPAS
jgi:hypothetical protein